MLTLMLALERKAMFRLAAFVCLHLRLPYSCAELTCDGRTRFLDGEISSHQFSRPDFGLDLGRSSERQRLDQMGRFDEFEAGIGGQ